jgi:hypothetical protein
MKFKLIAISALGILPVVLANPALAAAATAQPHTVNIKRLSLETAMRIAKASIDKCRKEGVQITVTVIDRGGDAQVVLRDTLAMDVSVPIKTFVSKASYNTEHEMQKNN